MSSQRGGSGVWSASQQPPPAHVVDALKQAQLLRTFTPTGVAILATIAQEKILPPGTPLFVQSMIGEGLFIVSRGHLNVTVRTDGGDEIFLTNLGPGESLGEAALLRSGPRFCSATAETETAVLEITRRDISLLQKTKPQACLKLMMNIADSLAQRLRASDDELRRFIAWRVGQGR